MLFAVNVAICLPLGKTVDIRTAEEFGGRGTWYELDEYTIGPAIGEISISNSTIRSISKKYTYYLITVEPEEGAPFQMAARVRANKSRSLRDGQVVRLYGMVSELTGEPATQAQIESEYPLKYKCLNDNGDTKVSRCMSAVVFALMAGICIALVVKIARRPIREV